MKPLVLRTFMSFCALSRHLPRFFGLSFILGWDDSSCCITLHHAYSIAAPPFPAALQAAGAAQVFRSWSCL
jgi:hypothetical protein